MPVLLILQMLAMGGAAEAAVLLGNDSMACIPSAPMRCGLQSRAWEVGLGWLPTLPEFFMEERIIMESGCSAKKY